MDDIQSNFDEFGVSAKFEDEVGSFGLRKLSYKKLESDNDLPEDIRQWMDLRTLRVMCNKRHRQMKKLAAAISSSNESEKQEAEEHLNRQKRALADWFLAPNTKWCGRGNQAEKYNHLGGYSRADACCRKHDHCKFVIKGMTTKWNLFNYRPYTISHCSCDIRKKRDLSSLLRIPGTKWCGAGWSASKYSEMGGLSRADRCCRKHDTTCPYWILGFETKYGLFNWRVGTLMHCSCDERFRTCLKMADSADANMVGRVFFNVLQTKCFVLKPEKICKERSWWGQCTKKGIRKRAHIRDNRKF
uniref:phospholipase A2 n=1 Tax=Culicoides sonorensis TaxID=179676 RepID=A0A336MXS9_CULSO